MAMSLPVLSTWRGLKPARAAGVPSSTPVTTRPCLMPKARSASKGLRVVKPMWMVSICPLPMSLGTMLFKVSTGSAKPTPTEPSERVATMAVFMPMSRPLVSRRGPPELPGFMAASVWMELVVLVL